VREDIVGRLQPLAVTAGGDPTLEASHLFDEVAIDFPSMGAALDRIRRSFQADEHPMAIETVLRVSRREALEGATVPLDVCAWHTCEGCGGRGESWTDRCARCRGTGAELVRRPVRVTIPAGVCDGARFVLTVAPDSSLPTRIDLRVRVDR
jgi:DnaJ-class molecular chaperone